MKRGSTLFLKIAVILIGIPVLALCIFLLPQIANVHLKNAANPDWAYMIYPILIGYVCIGDTVLRCFVSSF